MAEMLADLLSQEVRHLRRHTAAAHDGCRYCLYRQEHGGTGVPVFRVVDQTRGRVFLETDDWVDAEHLSMLSAARGELRYILGTHPSHVWGDRARYPHRCEKCDAPANGSFASHAPCGYDLGRLALLTVIEFELAKREKEPAHERNG
jgi:hypothetical protein